MSSLSLFLLAFVEIALFLAPLCSAEHCEDNWCMAGVRSANANPRGRASKDCVSFFMLKAPTTITTMTVTVQHSSPVTTHVLATITDDTATYRIHVPDTTVTVTDLTTLPTQLRTTATTTKTETVTATAVSTSYTTVTRFEAPPSSRNLYNTNAIPAYASECSGDIHSYSSACSCIGASTMPIVTKTIYETTTQTKASLIRTRTLFKHVTVEATLTMNHYLSETSFITQKETVTSYIDPIIVELAATTETTTTTLTKTEVRPGPTQWCDMYMMVQGGDYAGRLLYSNNHAIVLSPLGSHVRTRFQLGGGGRVIARDGRSADRVVHQIVFSPALNLATEESISNNKDLLKPVRCEVDSDTFQVVCESRTEVLHEWYFTNGDQTGAGVELLLKAFPGLAIPLTVWAIPVGCVS